MLYYFFLIKEQKNCKDLKLTKKTPTIIIYTRFYEQNNKKYNINISFYCSWFRETF